MSFCILVILFDYIQLDIGKVGKQIGPADCDMIFQEHPGLPPVNVTGSLGDLLVAWPVRRAGRGHAQHIIFPIDYMAYYFNASIVVAVDSSGDAQVMLINFSVH